MTREFVLADRLKNQFYVGTGSNTQTRRTRSGMSGRPSAKRRQKAPVAFARKLSYENDRRPGRGNEAINPRQEIKVKWKFISPVFIAVLAVATLMMMFLVFSFSEVYETSNHVTKLQNRLSELKGEEAELSLMLEEKNDLHEIETVAITKLGMVKEDSLQKKYVSLSEGERIEVLENNQESTEATGGVMLSTILSAIGNLFDRFR